MAAWHFRATLKHLWAIGLVSARPLTFQITYRSGTTRVDVCSRGPNRAGSAINGEEPVNKFLQQLWSDERGQDVAEYAVMLAVVLVIVLGTVRLIGTNSSTVFSEVGSSIQ